MDSYTSQFIKKVQNAIEIDAVDVDVLEKFQLDYLIVVLTSLQGSLFGTSKEHELVDEALKSMPEQLIKDAMAEYTAE